ncbi:MAG: hypothetical protein ACLPYS_07960 [Vulcanimicrobiaceae bacterium]
MSVAAARVFEELHVPDLRFGYAPVPPPAPGFDPRLDAIEIYPAQVPFPATEPIPGTQITGSYAEGERYVVRVPDAWNGKLVVAGTPGLRSEFSNDAIWGDYLLSHGYAFACSNKGIPYGVVVEPIAQSAVRDRLYPVPFDLLALETNKLGARFGVLSPWLVPTTRWNEDFAALTVMAQAYLGERFGRRPTRTYAVGASNGGAQVRSLLESRPELVDGGVDWEGVYWSPQRYVLDQLPLFLQAMPAYVAGGFTDGAAAAKIVAAGFPPDRRQADPLHPSLWFEYYSGQPSFYVDTTVFAYGLLTDPEASSSISPEGCTPNPLDPVYLPGTAAGSGLAQPAARAAYRPSTSARQGIEAFAHSGAIGKPLVSIAGTDDILITPALNATPYLEAVIAQGRGAHFRQYLVNGGTHVDTFAAFGYGLQPQLPFAWAAFEQLVAIVERDFNPAGAGTQRAVDSPSEIPSS